jgi:hypothetical protein
VSAWSTSRGRFLVAAAAVAAAALLVTSLALGGSSYEPKAVQDPCDPRPWRDPSGLQEMAEQFTLSALDGAACELRVTRETLALALAGEESRRQFAVRHGIGEEELEDAVQAGLVRAVDDAEDAGALSPLLAAPLREVAARIPVEEGIALIRDSERIFSDAGSVLGGSLGLLEEARGLLPPELRELLP